MPESARNTVPLTINWEIPGDVEPTRAWLGDEIHLSATANTQIRGWGLGGKPDFPVPKGKTVKKVVEKVPPERPHVPKAQLEHASARGRETQDRTPEDMKQVPIIIDPPKPGEKSAIEGLLGAQRG